MSDQVYHVPVLLNEVIEGLHINPDGIYVDCTFGGGGHSKAILSKLGTKGKLIAFDQDDDAKNNLPDDERLVFVSHNFRHLQRFLKLEGITTVDGIMADLGVSSHQFNEAERGFSIRFNAELDMRMDQRQTLTAFDVVQTYTEQQLHKLFEQYGEVTNSKTLAKTIVQVRNNASLKTIDGFKNALREIVKGNPNKYFAQVFQALRIEVNDELGVLKEMLQQIPSLLNPGGRAVIITFHSLEDRLVKNFFRRGSFEEPEENPFTNTVQKSVLKIITKKPVVPTDKEMKENPRSRSAKLRVAEKI
ncbi:MAG: 16S rRNA (cytosine(1402)-N(4))-methyltransferase RsmH [Chitinophagaceae bacterium]|nr:16S rRNA (cytosine(1402)-N(4))-methyltransferase RsmH [Chitinophagaceae bacterium]HRC02978.1 16S rRNA (cytosine(1402)-N(4))-methyltransferase RsmH [Niabella sp.]MBK8312373.1 16S rRNA (cytosine(1402)-N(4))-methyltransferase RsmH [Chitinophagaceae bacterium]MBP6477911.1 16S rRNA (cytosine(1402)-N(4))-methyltransferase RsmH [Chitinophagaceae bacterium]MBP7109134.1 16S rRNA (cytosine(1402)-N(4))-methyltransferase RsmH [Chitinophagaceae bacterium]